MCHYDEVVGSVAGIAAGRLTARRSCFSRHVTGRPPRRGGEGGDRAVNDDGAQRGHGGTARR